MLTLGSANPEDFPEVARVLASVFQDDPVMGPLIRGRRREQRFSTLFLAMLRSGTRAGMHVDVARDGTGTVVGAATWEPPRTRVGLLQQLPDLPTYLRALGLGGSIRALRLEHALAQYRPREPHWYLAEIGVGSGGQGKGVGSALLTFRLATVDTDDSLAYLESSTERNRSLYRRFGFSTTAQITTVPHAAPASMRRDPRSG